MRLPLFLGFSNDKSDVWVGVQSGSCCFATIHGHAAHASPLIRTSSDHCFTGLKKTLK
ncbi:predicted protein [Arabidopsis lyrata subsp. lyrata]|uniref:Predicted protein n=1 Tax=Arabidopsis lyrata subsp. lyrata TaxID=81972 RepID=D7KFA6_ARALL|nr:predicted protein [Arabidopsis lyrata subsp. lyrata]